MNAGTLALSLRSRLDEQGNVLLVAKHPVKNAFCGVEMLNYDDATRTLNLALREGEEQHYIDTLLNALSRTDAIAARRVVLYVNGVAGELEVKGLAEKRTFRDKYGEKNAVILDVAEEKA